MQKLFGIAQPKPKPKPASVGRAVPVPMTMPAHGNSAAGGGLTPQPPLKKLSSGPYPPRQHVVHASVWACSICTLENTGDTVTCEVCSSPRPQTTVDGPPVNAAHADGLAGASSRPQHSAVSPSAGGAGLVTLHAEIRGESGELIAESLCRQPIAIARQRFEQLRREEAGGATEQHIRNQVQRAPPKLDALGNASDSNNSRGGWGSSVPESPPRFQQTGGLQSDGERDYKESFANAGRAGGELHGQEWTTPLDNSALDPQRRLQSRTRGAGPPGGLVDGGGSRVNQPSGARQYGLGGYENGVYIDSERHLTDNTEAPVERAGASLGDVGVPFEVAAVGAKIRNVLRVGGERVKEMDHFVPTVRTPVVNVQLLGRDGEGNIVSQRASKDTDIGAYIQRATRSRLLQRANSVPLQGCNCSGLPELLVEEQYMSADCGGGAADGGIGPSVPSHIVAYAEVFWTQVLAEVFGFLGLELSPRSMQLYYVATMRADELVCSLSGTVLYVNVLAFQQSCCCEGRELAVGSVTKSSISSARAPLTVRRDKLKEVLSYWTMRVAIARSPHAHSSCLVKVDQLAASQAAQAPAKPTGLYDPQVRARFYQRLRVLLHQ